MTTEKHKQQKREWVERNRHTAKERSRASYLRNYEKIRARAAMKRAILRAEMIAAYGGRCACCGIDDPRFLTLDHEHNDGHNHRARVGSSERVLGDLRRQGWPKDGYRVLCFNCNCGRAHNRGVCPHATTYAPARPGWVRVEIPRPLPSKKRIKDCDGSASCPHCNPRAA